MIRRFFLRGVVLAAFAAALLSLPASAEPVPGKQDKLVAQLVAAFLQQGHLARPEITDTLSKRLFNRFLKDLDPTRVYFLKSDVEALRKYETELDDHLLDGDIRFAYQVY